MPTLTLQTFEPDPTAAEALRPELVPAAAVEALYVHVPFCFHKCHYCDFYSITRQGEPRMGRFVERVLAEASANELFGLFPAGPLVAESRGFVTPGPRAAAPVA